MADEPAARNHWPGQRRCVVCGMGNEPMTPEERLSAESTMLRAFIKYARHLERVVSESNQACRSAYEIAARRGENTNWDTFERQLNTVLQNQQAALNPEPGVQEERVRCADIVQAARFGEVDRDFRAIVNMIKGGESAEKLIEQAKPNLVR